MKKIPIHARNRNHYLRSRVQPDLFSWKQAPPRSADRAVLRIARRFGVSDAHASTIVHLAGIGVFQHES